MLSTLAEKLGLWSVVAPEEDEESPSPSSSPCSSSPSSSSSVDHKAKGVSKPASSSGGLSSPRRSPCKNDDPGGEATSPATSTTGWFAGVRSWRRQQNNVGDTDVSTTDGCDRRDDNDRARGRMERVLAGQEERERQAALCSRFVKDQRVRYYHRPSATWVDEARVVGVHLDDGPDKPYYTISYRNETGDIIEKQTTVDRLEYTEWDELKTWAILSRTM